VDQSSSAQPPETAATSSQGESSGATGQSQVPPSVEAQFEREERKYYGFGEEPSAAQRTAILSAMRIYFGALGEENAAKACALLSSTARASLTAVSEKGKGCEGVLGAINSDATKSAVASTKAPIKTIRLKGGVAYVFYILEDNVVQMQLLEQNGEWKPALPGGTVVAPAHPIGAPAK
jgi:hypothetical protein